MRNSYWHHKIHPKHVYFLNKTFPTRQAPLQSLIKDKIANSKQYRAKTKNFVQNIEQF